MDFSEIMAKLIEGHKVLRVSWENESHYLILEGGLIRLYKKGIVYDWVVSKEDMLATDWSII